MHYSMSECLLVSKRRKGDRRLKGKRIKEKNLEIEDGEVDGQWKIGT